MVECVRLEQISFMVVDSHSNTSLVCKLLRSVFWFYPLFFMGSFSSVYEGRYFQSSLDAA